jgi:hypothetical protein
MPTHRSRADRFTRVATIANIETVLYSDVMTNIRLFQGVSYLIPQLAILKFLQLM